MVEFHDIEDAARQVRPAALRTPLLEYPALNDSTGGRVLLKAENLQVTGSFKIRGAYNRISRLSQDELARGVIAWSSGNHAQGVAMAAKMMGTRAAILMPQDAPHAKLEGARTLGAEIILFDRYTEDREEIGHRLADERGLVLVPSYDDPYIIAGQGTCGLEVAEQAAEMDLTIDQMLVCAGGGGLTSGCAVALAERSPATKIFTVEPEGYDDIALSLAQGEPVTVDVTRKSIADALLPPTPGHLTWPLLKQYVTRGLVVSDDEIRAAVRFAFLELNLKVEPGGVAALAAALAGKLETKDRVTALTLSGGNVDPNILMSIVG